MNLESLRLVRNILLRSAVIGVGFTLFIQVVTLVGWDTWTDLAVTRFHADPLQFANLVLSFLTAIKFFLIFILLTPGLAIHWTIKQEQAGKAQAGN